MLSESGLQNKTRRHRGVGSPGALPQSGDEGRLSTTVSLVAATVASSALVWAFFTVHTISLDDIGLFNPIYMYVNYGYVAYPTYYQFHSMFIHPPTHYFVLGLIMKAGIPLNYAAQVPPLLLVLIAIVVICRSPFANGTKIALLLSLFSSFWFLAGSWIMRLSSLGIRPDLHAALAFLAGLVTLESGRLRNWDATRLFIGSFLLTYASGLSYQMATAFSGILVYLFWAVRAIGWRNATKAVCSLVSGGALFGIPYLVLFVVPCWGDITRLVTGIGAIGGTAASVESHLRLYQLSYGMLPDGNLIRFIFFPLVLGVPTVLVSTPILFLNRTTRGMALASLPHLLFVLLLVQKKWGFYLIAEFIVYLCSLGVLVLASSSFIVEKIVRYRRPDLLSVLRALSGPVLIALIVSSVLLLPVKISIGPIPDEFAIARAAGRAMLGPDALVAARTSRSYIFGETYSYVMLEPDLYWRSIDGLNLTAYFDKFDAVVEDPAPGITLNEQKETLSSWYAEGLLNLRGFYRGHQEYPGYILLAAHRPELVEGYELLENEQVAHFVERREGNYTFFTAVCEVGSLNMGASMFHSSFLLPIQDSAKPQQELVELMLRTGDYLSAQLSISRKCAIRDRIQFQMELIDPQALLAILADDQVIQFFSDLDVAVNARQQHLHIARQGSPTIAEMLLFAGCLLIVSAAFMRKSFTKRFDSISHWGGESRRKSRG